MKQMTVEEMEVAFELNRTPELLELMTIARGAAPEQIEIATTFLERSNDKLVANRNFDTFSHDEQITILRFMYDTINNKYYGSQLPSDLDIRVHILSENVVARYIRPGAYTPTVGMIQQYNRGVIESLPQQGVMFNELIICREPFSHRNVWPSFLEDTMAHEMVHEYNILHGIEDTSWKMKNGKFTVLGYHNSLFKKTAIEHGQTCKKSNSRNGFNSTHLITHFPLESWMTK